MKTTQLIIFGIIAIGIGLLITSSRDVSSYATFELAEASGNRVKIVGQLSKHKEMHYNPEKDRNHFSFYIADSEGVEKQVVYKKPKPQDFEMSEQIVLTGKMTENIFYADEMLLKCPSKYKDEEINLRKG
jgi:cytochrome c-type biogenesis protein CcmE